MTEAIWALIGVVIGTVVSGTFNLIIHRKQLDHEKELFNRTNQSEQNVRDLLCGMLRNPKYSNGKRSFKSLKRPIGGFADDQIRKELVAIGATKSVGSRSGTEYWCFDPQ